MDDARAWENYWRIHSSSGCIPDSPGVGSALGDCWRDFALQLPRRADVLDLGSGAGAVLDRLGQVRPDLKTVGVDSIGSLPRSSKFGTVLTGIRMEQLPFDDRSFDAVCSQFGVEYSDLQRTLAEVARTAKKGAPIRFVVHDASGPIVTQGKSRRDALVWAFKDGPYFHLAEQVIRARAVAPLPTPPALMYAAEAARKAFPREPVASEVMLALLQIVRDGEKAVADESAQRLLYLREQIQSEVATLGALLRSAKDEHGMADLIDLLMSNDAVPEKPKKIVDPSSRLAFAWLVGGRLG